MTFIAPKSAKIIWQIRLCVCAALITGAFLYAAVTASRYFYIGVGLFVGLGIFISFIYLPLFMKSYSITLKESGLCVRYGVFVKTEHFMPMARYIFTTAFCFPLSRAFGLRGMVFSAAKVRIVCFSVSLADSLVIERFLEQKRNFNE